MLFSHPSPLFPYHPSCLVLILTFFYVEKSCVPRRSLLPAASTQPSWPQQHWSYAACAPSRTTPIWASRSLPSSSARGHARCARITRRSSTAPECTTAAGRDDVDSSVPDGGDQHRLLALAFTQRYHAAPALSTSPSAAQGRFPFPSHYCIRRRKRSQASGMSSTGGPRQFRGYGKTVCAFILTSHVSCLPQPDIHVRSTAPMFFYHIFIVYFLLTILCSMYSLA
jgi:hypothetical protein